MKGGEQHEQEKETTIARTSEKVAHIHQSTVALQSLSHPRTRNQPSMPPGRHEQKSLIVFCFQIERKVHHE
jgi:hypothetical protein